MQENESDSCVVYQANPLIQRKNDFNLLETKLFLYCLTRLNPKLPNSKFYDSDFMKVTIPTKEVIEMFGGNAVYYEKLKEITRRLVSRTVIIERKHGFKGFSLFSEIDFDSKTGFTFEFHKNMYPFLLDLANRSYTRLDFEQLWKLNSVYAIRLLELMLQYRKIRVRTVTIEELRTWLGIPDDAYRNRIDNFKRFVIELPVKEINEKTKFTITYEYKKTGRHVTAVCFVIIEPAQQEPDVDDAAAEAENQEALQAMKKNGIDEGMAKTLLKNYGASRCLENVKYIMRSYGETAKNPAGYIVESIKHDFWAEHRKQMDKNLIMTMPADTPEQIEDIKLRAAEGDPFAKRRLELLEISTKRRKTKKSKKNIPDSEQKP